MEYKEKVVLKNGQDCIIRNAIYEDGSEMSDLYAVTHSESDYLLSYPEEHIKEYWGLGIGKAMMKACVQCAQNAGYQQLELEVVAENQRAENMYKSIGFVEYGRNPLGFISKYSGPQELVYMRLVL